MSTINLSTPNKSNSISQMAINIIKTGWQTNWLLTLITGLFLVQFVVFTSLSLFDDTLFLGTNAWFKPMKFAISSAFYVGTIVWMLGHIKNRRRLVNGIGYGLGAVLLGEVAIVAYQASRGVGSHYNLATDFDAMLFGLMGSMIMLLNVMTLVLALVLAFEKMQNKPLAWSMRLGVLVALLAGIPGYMMVAPTEAQAASLEAGETTLVVGAHNVGVEDGGPGLPFLGWSTEAGDLRPAHFIGLHALQILPLAGLFIKRRWGQRLSERSESQMVGIVGLSYAAFMFILIWQAQRGQSIVRPDLLTSSVIGLWAVLSVSLGALVMRNRPVAPQLA